MRLYTFRAFCTCTIDSKYQVKHNWNECVKSSSF